METNKQKNENKYVLNEIWEQLCYFKLENYVVMMEFEETSHFHIENNNFYITIKHVWKRLYNSKKKQLIKNKKKQNKL